MIEDVKYAFTYPCFPYNAPKFNVMQSCSPTSRTELMDIYFCPEG